MAQGPFLARNPMCDLFVWFSCLCLCLLVVWCVPRGACRKDLGRCRHHRWSQGSGSANYVRKRTWWTRWRCRRCRTNIPAGLQEKYRQAVSAIAGVCSSGSSSSSGGENEGPEIQRRKSENCVRNSSGTKVWKRDKELSANLQGEKVGPKKMGRWKLTRRLSARRSWIRERKSCNRD